VNEKRGRRSFLPDDDDPPAAAEKLAASPFVAVEAHPGGTVLPVRAQPAARRNEIRGPQDGQLKVCVTQSPEKGKANKAIIELLSKSLGLRKSQVELIAGETSHQKRFLVHDITPEELLRRIEQAMGSK